MGTVSTIATILGQPRAGRRLNEPTSLATEVKKGLPFHSLESVAARYGLPLNVIGPVLGIPSRTLARRKREGQLRADESDRLGRLARLLVHADDTFGDPAKVGKWLQRENRALGHVTPLSLLSTDAGTLAVDQILGRIDHGVFS